MDYTLRLIIYLCLVIYSGPIASADPAIDEFDNENLIEYHYRYAIDDSKSKGPVMDRWEHRIGEYVKGAYSVVDPDGRVRTVDYEVDGKKGYHAVIRMNEPSLDLLSFQQLSKSIELFPEAVLPAQPEIPSKNLSPPDITTGKAWNYHSSTPFVNQLGPGSDNKRAATTRIAKASPISLDLGHLPLSPANFNVPQTTNLIYFKTPAASVYQSFPSISGSNSISNNIKRQIVLPLLLNEENFLPRTRRNSKLLKRYKSMSEVSSETST